MLRSASSALISDSTVVDVTISDLYQMRHSLESAMKTIDKYLSQHSAQQIMKNEKEVPKKEEKQTEPKKTSKLQSLGICMFVNKRVLKERGILNKDQLEACADRCKNKAVHLKNDVLLCTRHKESDVSKIEDILAGIQPVIRTLDIERTLEVIEPETSYKSRVRQVEADSVDEAMEECSRLERLLEDTEKTIPCRIGMKEACLVVYKDVPYVIDLLGECYGKIGDASAMSSLSLKAKMKEYIDVRSYISSLDDNDREFLQEHSITYITKYLNL